MSTADTIYNIVKTLPEEQASEVLSFIKFLQYKQHLQDAKTQSDRHPVQTTQSIRPRMLTGLRGIAKRPSKSASDETITDEYADARAVNLQPAPASTAIQPPFRPASGRSLLRHAGKWAGDDLEVCLQAAYEARGEAEFSLDESLQNSP